MHKGFNLRILLKEQELRHWLYFWKLCCVSVVWKDTFKRLLVSSFLVPLPSWLSSFRFSMQYLISNYLLCLGVITLCSINTHGNNDQGTLATCREGSGHQDCLKCDVCRTQHICVSVLSLIDTFCENSSILYFKSHYTSVLVLSMRSPGVQVDSVWVGWGHGQEAEAGTESSLEIIPVFIRGWAGTEDIQSRVSVTGIYKCGILIQYSMFVVTLCI